MELYHHFLKLFGETRFVNLVKVFPASIKSIIPMQIYPHYQIICLYSKNICFYVFITDKCSNLFWNLFYSERVKISNSIILYTQSNPMMLKDEAALKIHFVFMILPFLAFFISVNSSNNSLFSSIYCSTC